MKTSWTGWPKEGFGFSNNVMGAFGPPSFNKARISYKGGVFQSISALNIFNDISLAFA